MSLVPLNDNLEVAQDYSKGYMMGRVVNNVDPTGQNKVQVSIPGLFEDGELPWVGIVKSSPFGIGKGFGSYGAPAIGSIAIVQLQNGDANYPICVGYIVTENDKDPRFANPKVWGFVDPSGNELIVNMEEQTWEFKHSSGTTYKIDQEGNMTTHVVGNLDGTVDGEFHLVVGSGTNITTTGNTTIQTSGTATVAAANAVVDAPSTRITGETIIEGLLRVMAGIIVQGDTGDGASAVFNGNVVQETGYIRSNGITLHTHTHGTPEGESDPPTPGT